MTSAPILQLKNVHTNIGPYKILHDISFAVAAGQITALLGRNGAGKTTTLRTIMGLCPPWQGNIHLAGEPLNQGPAAAARAGIGFLPENMGIFSDLTVAENMTLAAFGYSSPPTDRTEMVFQLFPPIQEFWEKPAGVLSGGQKQMLSLGRALILPRKILLLDEPTKGLAPVIINSFADALNEVIKQGTSVLLVEQNFAFASKLADHAVVIEDGRIIYDDNMNQLMLNEQLQDKYLGLQR